MSGTIPIKDNKRKKELCSSIFKNIQWLVLPANQIETFNNRFNKDFILNLVCIVSFIYCQTAGLVLIAEPLSRDGVDKVVESK